MVLALTMHRHAYNSASKAAVGSLKKSPSRNRLMSKMIMKIHLPLSTTCPRILTSYSTGPLMSKIVKNLSTQGIWTRAWTPKASLSLEPNLWAVQSAAKL